MHSPKKMKRKSVKNLTPIRHHRAARAVRQARKRRIETREIKRNTELSERLELIHSLIKFPKYKKPNTAQRAKITKTYWALREALPEFFHVKKFRSKKKAVVARDYYAANLNELPFEFKNVVALDAQRYTRNAQIRFVDDLPQVTDIIEGVSTGDIQIPLPPAFFKAVSQGKGVQYLARMLKPYDSLAASFAFTNLDSSIRTMNHEILSRFLKHANMILYGYKTGRKNRVKGKIGRRRARKQAENWVSHVSIQYVKGA